jgi:hypothetical protein
MSVRCVRYLLAAGCATTLAACGGDSTGPKAHPGGPGTTTLATAGTSAAFLDSAHFSTKLTLQNGAQYLIAVVNTDTSHSLSEDFTLVGALSASANRVGAPVVARSVQTPPVREARFTASPTLLRLQALRKLEKNHVRMLDRNTRVFQRLHGVRAAGASGLAASGIRKSISQTIGTVNKVYVAKAFGATCTDVDSIGARTVAIGQHVIVLADTNKTAWPDSLRPDSAFYQTFANEYDAITFPHITNVIGDPLAYDANLSHIGKITVTISPVLNNFGGGIVAFVDGCDFFPVQPTGQNADLDNFTEMFYYWVAGTNGFTVLDWENLMRATAAHETKHIVSYTDRIINNGLNNFETIWLEEGLAQESSEIWERHFNQATWKGHANFAQTVECEINLFQSGGCDPGGTKPIALIGSHLPFLFDYLNQESTSPTGLGLGTNTESNYGAGWEFARWATDQYGTSEASFIQSLVNEPTLSGVGNLAKHTGKTPAELLVYWNLATAIIDTVSVTATDVRTTIPSFNLGDIFFVGQTKLQCSDGHGGVVKCGLFTQSGSPVFPVAPTPLTTGPITQTVTGVPGTTAKYFLLTAASNGTETLELKSGAGAAISPSSGLRVGIIRVQ